MGSGRGQMCQRILAVLLIACVIAVITAVCLVYIPREHSGNQTHVNNTVAFDLGGASHQPTQNDDGVGVGEDKYVHYTGKASTFPNKEQWVSFEDMWKDNQVKINKSCTDHGWGDVNNSKDETKDMYNAIQSVAKASLVDHRLILAIILQESKGCVRVHATKNAVNNPGLMQSFNGSSFDPAHDKASIKQMIVDGTQGTSYGDGLVQNLDKHGDAYSAARGYNSGAVAPDGDLSKALGATACYASDVANRLTGWVKAPNLCVEPAERTKLASGDKRSRKRRGMMGS